MDSQFLFFLDCDFDDVAVQQVRMIAGRLQSLCWPLEPPVVVDQWDVTQDGAVRTSGLLLEVPGSLSPGDADLVALRGVEAVVAELIDLTNESELCFGAEFDGTAVGWVEAGVADRLLVEGLLGPWRERYSSTGETS